MSAEAWRANVAAAATLGAVLGALPGSLLLTMLDEPFATRAAAPAILLTSGVLAALLAAWTSNLSLDQGRTKMLPLLATAIVASAVAAGAWLGLVESGLWAASFAFPPYFGLLGVSLVLGAGVGFAALALRESFDWDALDVATSFAWSLLPPFLLAFIVRFACDAGACG